jgi:hypothetical protein
MWWLKRKLGGENVKLLECTEKDKDKWITNLYHNLNSNKYEFSSALLSHWSLPSLHVWVFHCTRWQSNWIPASGMVPDDWEGGGWRAKLDLLQLFPVSGSPVLTVCSFAQTQAHRLMSNVLTSWRTWTWVGSTGPCYCGHCVFSNFLGHAAQYSVEPMRAKLLLTRSWCFPGRFVHHNNHINCCPMRGLQVRSLFKDMLCHVLLLLLPGPQQLSTADDTLGTFLAWALTFSTWFLRWKLSVPPP